MSLSEDPDFRCFQSEMQATSEQAKLALEVRAAALVNPASGLANDFLNVYNEILMLIEMLPTTPELIDDISIWRPSSYRAYFMQSQLPGSALALETYATLPHGFRNLFEATIEHLAETGVAAVATIEKACAFSKDKSHLSKVCATATTQIRICLASAENLINFGRLEPVLER